MLISISGLDGAGKTTLIDWIAQDLRRQRREVAVLHLNDHVNVYAFARRLRDRVCGRQPSDGPPRMAPSPTRLGRLRDAILWSRVLRRLLYPLDVLLFLGFRLYLERLRGRVLIMDRYFYDTLVDVAGPGRVAWGWLRLLHRLTPTPDLPVLLEISPEAAFARKGEYTVDYLRQRADAYARVGPWVDRLVRLRTDALDAAGRHLGGIVRERLCA